MERNKSFWCDKRSVKASLALATSSGVGASITATISSYCGNAFSNAISRCRHGMSVEISLLMSVVMEKCVAAYHDDATVRINAAAMTDHAWCMQKSIARTTRAVIVFMGLSGMRWSGTECSAGLTGVLRRQEKGKMEALCSQPFVGAVYRPQSRHPCDIRRLIATPRWPEMPQK